MHLTVWGLGCRSCDVGWNLDHCICKFHSLGYWPIFLAILMCVYFILKSLFYICRALHQSLYQYFNISPSLSHDLLLFPFYCFPVLMIMSQYSFPLGVYLNSFLVSLYSVLFCILLRSASLSMALLSKFFFFGWGRRGARPSNA